MCFLLSSFLLSFFPLCCLTNPNKPDRVAGRRKQTGTKGALIQPGAQHVNVPHRTEQHRAARRPSSLEVAVLGGEHTAGDKSRKLIFKHPDKEQMT